jgi:hypothetical protein
MPGPAGRMANPKSREGNWMCPTLRVKAPARSVPRGARNQLVACGCIQADEAGSRPGSSLCHVPLASPVTLGNGRGLKLVGVAPVLIAITWHVNENPATPLPDDSWRR